MKRYILTGTPGCGKTCILRSLEVAGFLVVEEAATDIIALRHAQGIAEPHTHPSFIDDITNLQKHRQMRIADVSKVQFYDRSPICTYALSVFLGFPISITLADEMARIGEDGSTRNKSSSSKTWDTASLPRREKSPSKTP